MFSQSLIRVFKGLADFHGYVPVAPVTQSTPDKTTTACHIKPAVVTSIPKSSVVASCSQTAVPS